MSGSDHICVPLPVNRLLPSLTPTGDQGIFQIFPHLKTTLHLSDHPPVFLTKAGIESRILSHPDDRREDMQEGFSLFEILIALVVLTVITGMAAVSLGPYWQKHQLRQTTADLVEQIQICRMKAIVEQKTYQIKTAGQMLFRRNMSGVDWSDWERYRVRGPARISMGGTSSFYSKGFASPKTIMVIHDGFRQKIIININGRARVSDVY